MTTTGPIEMTVAEWDAMPVRGVGDALPGPGETARYRCHRCTRPVLIEYVGTDFGRVTMNYRSVHLTETAE